MVCVPVPMAEGVYVAEQELVNVSALPSETRVQVVPGVENAPAPELEKITMPAGSDFVPDPVSVTVAVQTEPAPTATLPGAHVTVVDVGRCPALKVTIRVPLGPMTTPQGLFVPVQFAAGGLGDRSF